MSDIQRTRRVSKAFLIMVGLFSASLFAGQPLYYTADQVIVQVQRSVEIQIEGGGVTTNHSGLQAVLTSIGAVGGEALFPLDRGGTRLSRTYLVYLGTGSDVIAAVNTLAGLECVSAVQPNYRSSDSAMSRSDFSCEQWGLRKIRLGPAWELFAGDETVLIADLDTGVDHAHRDLAANIWINSGDIAGNGIDDDGNGYVDDWRGWDFTAFPYRVESHSEAFWKWADNDPGDDGRDPFGFFSHGTHVAGIIGARANNVLLKCLDVVGVLGTCRIMAIQCCNGNGVFADTWMAGGIRYAVDNGAQVINMSWGSEPGELCSDLVYNALQYARARGVVLCAAAGNDDESGPCTPAACDGVISVAALKPDDRKADFSNFGSTVDLAAPGVEILSTVPDNDYAEKNGTSMACPFVSGAAGLILGYGELLGESFTPAQVAYALTHGTDSIDTQNPEYAGMLGAGRLNVYNSLLLAETMPRMIRAIEIYGPEVLTENTAGDFRVRAVYTDGTAADVTARVSWSLYPFPYGQFSDLVPGRLHVLSVPDDRDVIVTATLTDEGGPFFGDRVVRIQDDPGASSLTILGPDALGAELSARYKAVYQDTDGRMTDLTERVTWEVTEGMAEASFDPSRPGCLRLEAVVPDQTIAIKAMWDDPAIKMTCEQMKTGITAVTDRQVAALSLIGPTSLAVGTPVQLTARLMLADEEMPVDVTRFATWSSTPESAGTFGDSAGRPGYFIPADVDSETTVTLTVRYGVGERNYTAESQLTLVPAVSLAADTVPSEETGLLMELLSWLSCSLPGALVQLGLIGGLRFMKDGPADQM